MATIESLANDLKSVHRDIRKIRQMLEDPSGEKAKARSENNGFKKPIKVDDELRSFLKLAPDQLISRSEVTRAVNVYAEEHKLKSGQVINLDDKLRSLLNPPANEVVTFLKLQKYLAPHYVKEVKESVAAPVVAEPVSKPRVKKA